MGHGEKFKLAGTVFRLLAGLCSNHVMRKISEKKCLLGMGALVLVLCWNMNVIMVWALMLWSPYPLGTRRLLWFGQGCSGHRMLSEHERNYGLRRDALVTVCTWTTKVIIMVWAWMLWSPYAFGTHRLLLWSGHGCSGHLMLSKHDITMVWAWMLWSPYAFGTQRLLLWSGHGCSGHLMLSDGCSGHLMLSEHESYHGFGMDGLVTVRT